MKMNLIITCVILTTVLTLCHGFLGYKRMLPDRVVPNLCTTDNITDTWKRLGHVEPNLTGIKAKDKKINAFGKDFSDIMKDIRRHRKSVNDIWPELCKIDSDGDGRNNGIELGDANCTWRIIKPTDPDENVIITNPGIHDADDGSMTPQIRMQNCPK